MACNGYLGIYKIKRTENEKCRLERKIFQWLNLHIDIIDEQISQYYTMFLL